MEQPNWAEQLKALIDKYPLFILISIVAALIGYATTINQAIRKSIALYNTRIGWKHYEEQIINSLLPATDIARFQEVLGNHLFRRTSSNGYTEYVFRRHGYWVQAITNAQGSVVLYAITSCDNQFRPRIKNNPAGVPIRLRATTFKAAAGNTEPELHYFISGATANSYLIEEAYLGNPGRYQTVFWGFNDACSNEFAQDSDISLFHYLENRRLSDHLEPPNPHDPEVDAFRAQNTFNTFAVTAPFVDTKEILQEFQIGIDRTQVRILPPN